MTYNITILISGNGTNLQAIIDAIKEGILLNTRINAVISNKTDAYGLTRAIKENIPTYCLLFDKKIIPRYKYNELLLQTIKNITPKTHLIVLAGWMFILGKDFLDNLKIPIINLHPALPYNFPGTHAIEQAFDAFGRNEIKSTGCMIHHVVPVVDTGTIIETCEVPIFENDTLDTLTKRVNYFEKPTLLKAILKLLNAHQEQVLLSKSNRLNHILVKRGKVRDVYDIGFNLLAMVNTNRFSSFDRHICEIPYKGMVLNLTSSFWFEQTNDIIKNHLYHANENIMIVEKCEVIPIEVVLRQYITGSTDTSLWTHYNKGEREYCGLKFPDGLVKNEKLKSIVITPTTKNNTHDQLISAEEIIKNKICTEEEWKFISKISLELFERASSIAANKNFILVDTKLEFGRDVYGNIILVDEIFTCDSSRYWIASTYQEKFNSSLPPQSLDKDIIREYIRNQCDPYVVKTLPEIPIELIDQVSNTYINFYQTITGKSLDKKNNNGLNENIHEYIYQFLDENYDVC